MTSLGVMHPNPIPPPTSKHIIVEAKKRGFKTKYLRPQEITVSYSGKETLFYLRSRELTLDIIFPRGTTLHGPVEQHLWRTDIVKIMEENGITAINNYQSISKSRDKALTPLYLRANGIPFPPTIITENISIALTTISEWGSALIKPLMGSLGRGIILVKDPDTAYPILKQLLSWGQPLIIQKFIEKKDNKDLRALIINGQAYATYYRKGRKGTFKTNVAQGAVVEQAKPSEEIIEIAIKTTEALGLFYAGVDIAESVDGELYVLEANASPNWMGAIQLGYNPAGRLVEEAVKNARK